MRRTARVPKLSEHDPTFGMGSIDNSSPALDLLLGVKPRCTEPAAAGNGDVGSFADDKAAIGCPLSIVLSHQISGNGVRLDRARTGEWGHYDPVLQLDRSELYRGE